MSAYVQGLFYPAMNGASRRLSPAHFPSSQSYVSQAWYLRSRRTFASLAHGAFRRTENAGTCKIVRRTDGRARFRTATSLDWRAQEPPPRTSRPANKPYFCSGEILPGPSRSGDRLTGRRVACRPMRCRSASPGQSRRFARSCRHSTEVGDKSMRQSRSLPAPQRRIAAYCLAQKDR